MSRPWKWAISRFKKVSRLNTVSIYNPILSKKQISSDNTLTFEDVLASNSFPSPKEIDDILHNPIYTGIPPYPSIVDEKTWITAAKQLIEEEGVEAYLSQMLSVLRESMEQGIEVIGAD